MSRAWAGTLGAAAVVVALASFAPLEIVLGAGRLVVLAAIVTGAWLTVGRARVPDLAAGLHVALGALVGGVTPSLIGLPVLAGAPLALVAGAASGGAAAALLARVGRLRGAIVTLALSAAAPPLAAGWPGAGGAAGFHAVPLVTGADGADLALVTVLLTGVGLLGVAIAERPVGAHATVALAAPDVAEAGGRPATRAALPLGAAGGTLLSLAGWGAAVLSGSVLPDAYGLPLAGLAAVGAVLAGRAAWAALVAAVLLGAPSVLFPLAPVVGDAPPLLTTGVLAVALVLWRGPLVPYATPPDRGTLPTPAQVDGLGVEVDDLRLPGGARVDLVVAPGEIVQLSAPNGWGKSTLLAMLAGQLPDGGAVRLDGRPAPRGAVARARLGVARSWQRAPDVTGSDLLPGAGVAAPTDPGRAAVAAAIASTPRLLVLDEPSAFVREGELEQLLRGARAAGTTILLVEHRAVPGVDRVVDLTGGQGGAP